jgi:hypothetical protein
VSIPLTLSVALPSVSGGLIGTVVGLIFHGDLITSRMLDRLIANYVQRLAEKDEQIRLWRDAHDTVKKTNDALITSLYQSLEIGKTTMGVVGSIPVPPTPSTGGSGDTHVVA